jgi:hypothetical protein
MLQHDAKQHDKQQQTRQISFVTVVALHKERALPTELTAKHIKN